MFRLFLRDACAAALLIAVFVGAGVVLGLPALSTPPAMLWHIEAARIAVDPLLLVRDGALALLALAAFVEAVSALGSGVRLLGGDYPAMAHLLEALASRLVRRAGALVGVALATLQGAVVVRAAGGPRGAIARPTLIAAPRPRAPAGPRSPTDTQSTADAPMPLHTHPSQQRARRPRGRRMPRLAAGLALRYIVQPDDTMDGVAARFGLPDWRPLMRATRGLAQPVGGPITDPNLIYPGQILLIPLPCPALRLVGDHVLYVVQRGDYLSEIAARFLGDWRRYKEIGALNHGVHQPDGGALEDDNLIQLGWVLRLPQEYVTTEPNGALATRHVVVAHTHPARLRHSLHPRRPRAHAGGPVPATPERSHAARSTQPHTRITPTPTPGDERRHAALCPGDQPSPPQALPHPAPGRHPTVSIPTTRGHQAGQGHSTKSIRHGHGAARPKPGVHPTRRRGATGSVPWQPQGPFPTAVPVTLTVVPGVTPQPQLAPSGTVHRPREGHEKHGMHPDLVPLPMSPSELQLWWPLSLLLVFVPLLAAVARKRRRSATVAAPPGGRRLAPSMRRAIEAVQGGIRGRLETAVDAAANRQLGDPVRPLLTALDQAAGVAGLPCSVAPLVRQATVSVAALTLLIEAREMDVADVDRLAEELTKTLGLHAPLPYERIADPDGSSSLRLTIDRHRIATLPPVEPDFAAPHPVPLLVPLGRAPDGRAHYINLARLGSILIAGGAYGSNTLVATLLASVLAQATPDQLHLLVASADDELRHMLPALDHLEAPPADASDAAAMARIGTQAQRVVLERFTAGEDGAIGPQYLVVLDNIETLRADQRALDHLDILCRNGRVCGVHVVAMTGDPAELANLGLLDSFGVRLVRALTEGDSKLLFGEERAARLAPDEVLLQSRSDTEPLQITPFLLTLPEVREVIAHLAVALAPDDSTPDVESQATGDAPDHAPNGSPLQTRAGGVVDELPGMDTKHVTEVGQAASMEPDPGTDGNVDASGTPTCVASAAMSVVGQRMPAPSQNPASEPSLHALEDDRVTPASGTLVAQPANAAVAPVTLRVFGGIAVTAHGTPLVLQPREQRLLAALAVMGPAPVPADRLVEALFSDDDPLTGQDKLQHSITDIRLALKKSGVPVRRAGVVRYATAGYTLDPPLISVDAYRFREWLRQAETVESAQRFALLANAIDIYTGDLCGDQALEWVEGYRYAWRKEYLAALYELAVYYDHEGNDPLGALRVARRLAAEDPLQDHYHQMVLELIASTGDLDALDTYASEICVVYASHDTDMDGYTNTLYERLRARLLSERTRVVNAEATTQVG